MVTISNTMRYAVLALVLGLVTQACLSPVRNRIFPDKERERPEETAASALRPPDLQGVQTIPNSARDTVYVDQKRTEQSGNADNQPSRLQNPQQQQQQQQPREADGQLPGSDYIPDLNIPSVSLVSEFENSLNLFDQGQYSKACDQFENYTQLLPEGDSLWFEALLMQAECRILKSRYWEAARILESASLKADIPLSVYEKTLLRLGQTYCLLDDKAKATEVFDVFSAMFPESPYHHLANCQVVEQ